MYLFLQQSRAKLQEENVFQQATFSCITKTSLFLNNGSILNVDVWEGQGSALYLVCSFSDTN